jgi:hypothetical protein
MKKYLAPLNLLLLVATFVSLWLFPPSTLALAVVTLLFSLGTAIYSIFDRHKGSENAKPKIAREMLILLVTLLLIVSLGGLAGLFASSYFSPRFGETIGLFSALVASFVLGYLVKKGIGKLIKEP